MVLLIDVAKEATCDPISVRRWVKENQIEAFKIKAENGKWAKAISEEDASRFIKIWRTRGQVPKGFVSVNELAKKCGVDINTVKAWGKVNNAIFEKYRPAGGKPSWMIDKKSAEMFGQVYVDIDRVIAVDDLLEKYQCNWRAANRWAKRTKTTFLKIKTSGRSKKGLLPKDAEKFEAYLKEVKEGGYFYLIQLLPECLPGRVKFGYAYDPENRLAVHRVTCPNARL